MNNGDTIEIKVKMLADVTLKKSGCGFWVEYVVPLGIDIREGFYFDYDAVLNDENIILSPSVRDAIERLKEEDR